MHLPRLFQPGDHALSISDLPEPLRDEAGLGKLAVHLELDLPSWSRKDLQQRIAAWSDSYESSAAAEEAALTAVAVHSLHYFHGRHLIAGRDLGLAWQAAEQASPVCRGFVRWLMARFLLTVGLEWGGALLLDELVERPVHPVLSLLAEWDLARIRSLRPGSAPGGDLERFKPQFAALGLHEHLPGVDLNVARVLIRQGQVKEAAERIDTVYRLASEGDNQRQMANILLVRAELQQLGRQDAPAALADLELALDLCHNAAVQTRIQLRRSQLLHQLSRSGEAREAAERALDLAEEHHLRYFLPECCAWLGSLLQREGRPAEAVELLRRGYGEARLMLQAGYDMQAFSMHKAVELYVSFLEAHQTAEDLEDAYPFAQGLHLEDIRRQLQATFLQAALDRPGNLSQKARELGLSRQSLLTYRKTLTRLPASAVPPELRSLVERHSNMPWHAFMHHAESRILSYLLRTRGGSRRQLAQDLGISPSRVSQILRQEEGS